MVCHIDFLLLKKFENRILLFVLTLTWSFHCLSFVIKLCDVSTDFWFDEHDAHLLFSKWKGITIVTSGKGCCCTFLLYLKLFVRYFLLEERTGFERASKFDYRVGVIENFLFNNDMLLVRLFLLDVWHSLCESLKPVFIDSSFQLMTDYMSEFRELNWRIFFKMVFDWFSSADSEIRLKLFLVAKVDFSFLTSMLTFIFGFLAAIWSTLLRFGWRVFSI